MQTHDEKTRLEELIRKANDEYWNGKETTFSDVEYDRMVRRLEELDPENPLVTGLPEVSVKKKVEHKKPMLSLAKAYSLEEVLKWCRKVSRSGGEVFKIQPKYDGLSGKLEGGVLSSRGDGKFGEDYSAKLPFIKFEGKPLQDGSWLGEMLISDEDFRYMKAAGLKGKAGNVFKNQRNAAAGLIGTDDLEYLAGLAEKMKPSGHSLLTFVDYELRSWYVELCDLEERWEEVKSLILKSGYPMDGIVIKLADQEYADSLGFTEHHPRGAIAFKFTNQSAWTTLRKVTWTMGKDQIAAIGEVDPVDISGTTIKNVKLQLTAPKSSEVKTWLLNGSLQVNDAVLIERAGDIIPHVVESKPGQNRQMVTLTACPFCGAKLEIGETSIRCTNDKCSRKAVEKLLFAMITLGFKGVGEAYATNLYKILGIDSVYKLMTVNENALRMHPEFGDKMVDIFIGEQQKALKEAGELKALVAMDIPSVGKFVGNLLLERFGVAKLVAGAISEDEMLKVKGIGKVAAEEASEGIWLRKDEIRDTLALFKPLVASQQKPAGDRICFTGKMSKTRGEMEKIAADHGMTPVDHVDKDTKWLVCADPSSGSSKMQKAKKLGCSVISEAEFFKMTEAK